MAVRGRETELICDPPEASTGTGAESDILFGRLSGARRGDRVRDGGATARDGGGSPGAAPDRGRSLTSCSVGRSTRGSTDCLVRCVAGARRGDRVRDGGATARDGDDPVGAAPDRGRSLTSCSVGRPTRGSTDCLVRCVAGARCGDRVRDGGATARDGADL